MGIKWPRLAIIGCGAVVEQSHAPALRRLGWPPAVLVDPSPLRKAKISRLLGANPIEAVDPTAATDHFDVAIVATPHNTHSTICSALLAVGKHVLVEKPMAASFEEAQRMNVAARSGHARLAVALMRRQAKVSLWLKAALTSHAFGTVRRFVVREGYEYGWPLVTDSMWRREQAGGGVLMDTGAHTLDQIIWWFGRPDDVEYFDDSAGGVEADCLIRLKWKSGTEGEIELSRTRRLSNSITIHSEKGSLVAATLGNTISGDAAMLGFHARGIGSPMFKQQSVQSLFEQQLKSFATYVTGGHANVVSGMEAADSVALIERCYAVRRPLEFPWFSYPENVAQAS